MSVEVRGEAGVGCAEEPGRLSRDLRAHSVAGPAARAVT
jgi:hypothetical protein